MVFKNSQIKYTISKNIYNYWNKFKSTIIIAWNIKNCEMYNILDNLTLFLTILIIFRVMLFIQKQVVVWKAVGVLKSGKLWEST